MHTEVVLHYGHQTILESIEPIPVWAWDQPGVCGVWSVKDVIAHLASFEQVLGEVLSGFFNQASTPLLDRFLADTAQFNLDEVARRHDLPHATVLTEYCQSYANTTRLLTRIPVEMRQQRGTLPWYGDDYDLDDFMVYTFYGHKREHAAQIAILAEHVARSRSAPVTTVAQ